MRLGKSPQVQRKQLAFISIQIVTELVPKCYAPKTSGILEKSYLGRFAPSHLRNWVAIIFAVVFSHTRSTNTGCPLPKQFQPMFMQCSSTHRQFQHCYNIQITSEQ